MTRFCANHPENQAVAFCVKCGTPLCPACERPVEGRPYCQLCLDIARREKLVETIQKLQPSEETVAKAKSAAMLPISNKEIRRILALAVDTMVVFAGAAPLSLVLLVLSRILMPIVHGISFPLSYYISLLLFGGAYYIIMHWRTGRTIGKKMFGLKVYRTNGSPLTLTGSFWRLTGFLCVIIWALGGWIFARQMMIWMKIAQATEGGRAIEAKYYMLLYAITLSAAILFSLGVIITFVGKHKRGFHDILGNSIVKSEGWAVKVKGIKFQPAAPVAKPRPRTGGKP